MNNYLAEQNGKFYTMSENGSVSEVTSDFDKYQKITVEKFIEIQTEIKNAKIAELAKNSPYKIGDTFQYYYEEEKAEIANYILMNNVLHYELKQGRQIVDKNLIDECKQRENEFLQKIAESKAKDKARAEQEQKELERIAKEYKYFNAYITFLGCTSLQAGKLKKVLDKKYRYTINNSRKILTRKEFILHYVQNDCVFKEKTFYNDKCKNNKQFMYCLFHNENDDTFSEITKTEYNFGMWLQDYLNK